MSVTFYAVHSREDYIYGYLDIECYTMTKNRLFTRIEPAVFTDSLETANRIAGEVNGVVHKFVVQRTPDYYPLRGPECA